MATTVSILGLFTDEIGVYETALIVLLVLAVIVYPLGRLLQRRYGMKKVLARTSMGIGGLLFVVVGSWGFTWITSPVPLKVGPETTVVEGPMRDDGTVDYLAALNREYGEGVTATNNAFVPIARVMPPRQWGRKPDLRGRVFEKLGVDSPGKEATYFASFET